MLDALQLPYVQRALVEIALLAVVAGLLGTWIVVRGLAFYAHAVGTTTFPGLVLADGLGFSPLLGAAATAAMVAALVVSLSRRDAHSYDSLTALALVGALAVGVVLASDVFESQGNVDRLLFGSLLLVDVPDQVMTAGVALAALVGTVLLGRKWLAIGLDPEGARALGVKRLVPDLALLALIAAAAVAALDSIGALLAAALLVMPAATTRLMVRRLPAWRIATTGLALFEGAAGLMISVELNAPPGAAIAVLAGAIFVVVAAGWSISTRMRVRLNLV